jgi:RNA polymerase sigma-70 factor (ECF subfamily)
MYRTRHAPSAREEPVSGSVFDRQARQEHSETPPWLRTDVKNRFHALCAQFEPEDRRILELRLERRLSWNDVARATAGPDELLTAEELHRKSANLRQQYRRITLRLRTLFTHEEGFCEGLAEVG